MTDAVVNQTVAGQGNIVTGTGDINVSYVLSPAHARERQGLLILAGRVREFWVHGILEKSVHDATLMELVKEARPEAVENPWDTVLSRPTGQKENISPSEPLRELFARVSYTLLILGEEGSGKTVTLLQLARELLTASETDSRLPVPVVLNLSSWSGKRLPIFDWVIEELRAKYYVPAQSGRAWLETNRLLLLLDGLDEVQAADRAACVYAINEFMAAHGVSGLAICSRQREYLALETRLRLGGAISLQPLSDAQVDSYLSHYGEALQPLAEMLASDEQLKILARSPLMLSIMTLGYPRSAPMQTKGESVESRREQIFAAYVEQMFNRRRNVERGFSASQVRHYLHELAQELQRRAVTVFMLDELQPNWLRQSRSASILYWYTTRIVGCLTLAAVVAVLLVPGYQWGLVATIMTFGVFAGIVEGTADLCLTNKNIQSMRGSVVLIGLRGIFSLFAYSACAALLWFLPALEERNRNPFITLPNFDELVFLSLVAGLLALVYWSGIYLVHAARSPADYDILPADRIVWRWRGSWKGVPWGIAWTAIVSAAFLMISSFVGAVIGNAMSIGFGHRGQPVIPKAIGDMISVLWSMGGVIIVAIVLVVGAGIGILIAGLRPVARTEKIRPNDSIRLSLFNGLKWGATLGVFIGPLFLIGILPLLWAKPLTEFARRDLVFLPIMSLPFIVLVGFCYGWLDVIHHWVLRLLLYWRNVLPFRAVEFLNYSCDLIFLQRVGGGYIFIHRLILDYFASLQVRENSPRTESMLR